MNPWFARRSSTSEVEAKTHWWRRKPSNPSVEPVFGGSLVERLVELCSSAAFNDPTYARCLEHHDRDELELLVKRVRVGLVCVALSKAGLPADLVRGDVARCIVNHTTDEVVFMAAACAIVDRSSVPGLAPEAFCV